MFFSPVGRGQPIPQWALPYVVVLLGAVAVFLFFRALTHALERERPTKLRVGNAMGYTGLGLCFAVLGVCLAFGLDLVPVPFAAFVCAMVVTAIGGSMAGWQRN